MRSEDVVSAYQRLDIESIDAENHAVLRLIARLKESLDKENFRTDPEFGICLKKLISELKNLLRAEEEWYDLHGVPLRNRHRKTFQGVIQKLESAANVLGMPQGIHHRRIADYISKFFRNHLLLTAENIRSSRKNAWFIPPQMPFYFPVVRGKNFLMRKEL